LVALLLLIFQGAWVNADVTIKQTTNGKVLGESLSGPSTAYIKGNKMRSEAIFGDRIVTSIYDLDAQKLYIFNSKKKQADVWDMAAFTQELSKVVNLSSLRTSMKKNGQTREIGGHEAVGYNVEASVESAMDANPSMGTLTVNLQGPMWIVQGSPGTAEYSRFYKAAVDQGWVFMDPRAAKSQPGQAKAMAEMYKQVAEAGGIPYEVDLQIKTNGSGPLGALMSKLGNMSLSTVLVSIDTGSLPDALFLPPPDYKLISKK
jgi:hypothetical protein